MNARMLAIGLAAGFFVGGPCLAQVTAEQLAAAEIRTQKVGDNLYVLFGLGGNILVSVGRDGTLAVDTEFPELVPRYLAAIREVGGGSIDIAINTHWHYDHADGNLVLGPTGTWIIAHANSRQMLTKDNVINTVVRPPFPQKAYPAAALPVATFTDKMQLNYSCYIGNEFFGYGEEICGNEGTIRVMNRTDLWFEHEQYNSRRPGASDQAPAAIKARAAVHINGPQEYKEVDGVINHFKNFVESIKGTEQPIAPPKVPGS